jgi:uncharacterized OsmC-like protein
MTTLREIQDPLKQRYRVEPEAAQVTLSATGQLGDGVSCSINTGRAMAEAGLHPATGGDGTQLCSGDMLLEALVACAGVTLRAVATALGLEVSGSVRAEGDLDFRGTLEALVACAGVTLGAVAASLGLDVRGGSVNAEGDLDFRGTLAVDKDVRVGFTAIRLSFELDTDASPDELATLQKLTERYCVVLQSIISAPQVSTTTISR